MLPTRRCVCVSTLQGLAGRPVLYRGTLDCIRQVLRTDGIKGFYAASLPSYLKVSGSLGSLAVRRRVFCTRLCRAWGSAHQSVPPLPLEAGCKRITPAAGAGWRVGGRDLMATLPWLTCRLQPLRVCPLQVAPSIGCMYFLFEVFMAHSARLPPLNLRLPQPVQQAAPEAAAPAVASS